MGSAIKAIAAPITGLAGAIGIGKAKDKMDAAKSAAQRSEKAIAAENARIKQQEEDKKKRRAAFQSSISQAGDVQGQMTTGGGLFGN